MFPKFVPIELNVSHLSSRKTKLPCSLFLRRSLENQCCHYAKGTPVVVNDPITFNNFDEGMYSISTKMIPREINQRKF